jgi:hypothetical protein
LHPPARFLQIEDITGGKSKLVRTEYPTGVPAIPMSTAVRRLGSELGARLKAIKSSALIRDLEFAKCLRQLW